MANYYDEQLSRMSHLMFYNGGSESKKSNYTTVMNMKEGADGRVYGIVAEGTKYYVKSCPKGKENLTESFDYIGGFLNRKECEYSSYADAVKDMDMRLMSLNEDHGKRMVINEMKRSSDFMDTGMVEMQESIARHRQILENIDAIYQGGKGKIGDRNIGVPEAPKTQEFNTKVGDPFEDSAKYEENRDNKENAKDHEKQGDPFEDEAEYKENTDNIQKQDSNLPGDTYTKKPEYVPDDAIAAMRPSGKFKAVKMNESIKTGEYQAAYEILDDYCINGDWDVYGLNGMDEMQVIEDLKENLGVSDEVARAALNNWLEEHPEIKSDYMGSYLKEEKEEHFPEENPGLGAEEFGEMGDHTEEIPVEDMKNGVIMPDSLEADEFLARFDDNPEETGQNEIAGIKDIEDMSGVDRNNLSSRVINDIVGEAVARFSKNKKLNMISESVAKSIISEMLEDKDNKKEREYFHDSDFEFGVPEKPTPDSDFKSPSPLSGYMDKGTRVQNKTKNGTLDPRKGAPSYVNPGQVDYDPNSEYYLQNKYELGLNDEPGADVTETGAWKATEEKARKYATARVAKAQNVLEMIGSELNIDTEKAVDVFRHALYVFQEAKDNLAIMLRIHPEMIDKFLVGNNIPFRNVMGSDDNGNLYGYRDAKDTPKCIITPDGELPLNSEMNDDEEGNVNYVIGPSLKAMGFPEMSTPKLEKLVEGLLDWDDDYGTELEAEENKMREVISYIQSLGYSEDAKYAKTLNNVVTEWVSLLEDIAGLQSFSALPAEVLNKREEAANLSNRRFGRNIRGGYEEFDGSVLRNLHEDKTVLHSFGDHPGYRKKPMTTPANIEITLNDTSDWNDDSTKGEEPFGKKIGSSAPFTDIVNTVTKEVLKALGKGGQN